MSEPVDCHYTPIELARAIVARLVQYGDLQAGDSVLDPCVGKGAFARAIFEACPDVKPVLTIDVDPEVKPILCRDFLQLPIGSREFQLVASNPPFSLWQEFVAKSVGRLDPRGTVAFLLRLSCLGDSQKQHRREFLREYPPSSVDILRPRPSFYGGSDNCEYALIRWCPVDFDALRNGGARLGFIDWEKPRRQAQRKPNYAADEEVDEDSDA